MALFRYRLRPLSAFATPMRSDTLYGHLLWAAAEREGVGRVQSLIERFAGSNPPFRLSSAFPAGLLPMPVMPGIKREIFRADFASGDSGSLFDALNTYKRFRKVRYLPLAVFEELGGRVSQSALFRMYCRDEKRFAAPETCPMQQPHNSIDRRTSTVLKEGGLHFGSAVFYGPEVRLDIYVETDAPEEFDQLFQMVAETGFGADRTTGKGHFAIESREEAHSLAKITGSHHLLLSVCSASSLAGFAGFYAPFVKHGRAWSGFGQKNPFKKPFVAFAEGSVFKRLPASGFVLRDIHSDPSIVQIVWPLTISCRLEDEK